MRVAMLAVVGLSLVFGRRASASPDHDSGPVHLDFKIEAPDQKAPLASGALDVEPFQMSWFEAREEGAIHKLALKFTARPQRDGTVGVYMEVAEVDADGQEVRWAPAIQGKRGVPLSASIHAGELTRTITVTVK